jgi:gliding motility-associated-like protein
MMPSQHWVLLQVWLWAALLYFGTGLRAIAQRENEVWYFGQHAGLSFATGWPVPLTDGALASREACASVADAAGTLQCYTDGITVWNRFHQPLVNGTGLGGFLGGQLPPNSATQGALLVPHPGNSNQYFLFGVDAMENDLRNGLQVALVDLSAQSGRGEVLSKGVRLPTPTLSSPVTEKLVAVRHANGRDTWVVVHGWETNAFMAFLVSPTGVSAAPVTTSLTGTIHQGNTDLSRLYNAIGCMAVSPDGRRLALTQYDAGVEVFDFDPQTGRVSNARALPPSRGNLSAYGVAFSPSGDLLYASGHDLVQYDLGSGTQLILAFGRDTGESIGQWALQLGPDDRLYLAAPARNALDAIEFPDVRGAACGVRFNALAFASPAAAGWGLPNALVVPRTRLAGPALGFQLTPACAGASVQVAAGITPAPAGASYAWDFGDPAAGPANTARGAVAAHTFSAPGVYTVRLQGTWPGAPSPLTAQQRVVIGGPPVPTYARFQVLCGPPMALTPTAQPLGVAFRWQDGFSAPVRYVTAPGLYWVDITSPLGCTRRDTVEVSSFRAEQLALAPDTATCFVVPVVLRVTGAPSGLRYRWPDGSNGPTFAVQAPGTYTVQVSAPSGCFTRELTRRVDLAPDCGAHVPNIITPNGDEANETWVLRGLNPTDWGLNIYTRWGQRVYAQARYDNRWRAEGLPSGVYYYQLTYVHGPFRQLRGWVEVVR